MSGLFKRMLRKFTSSSSVAIAEITEPIAAKMSEELPAHEPRVAPHPPNERHIVNPGFLQRENCFVAVINCKRFRPSIVENMKAAVRKLTSPRCEFTLINEGEIIMHEKLIIISKEEIPLFADYEDELKEMNRSSKTEKKFKFTNKGRLEISTNVYFIVNNYNDFMTTGVLRQLTDEGIGSVPITSATNTGSVTKTVEIVHGLSEEEARVFEQNCISSDPSVRIATESHQAMMRQFDVTLEDARCFDLTLSSIPDMPTVAAEQ